jgi:deoxyribonuclease-4
MLFGAHVSIAGGIPNAPLNAAKIGCEVFQFFTRSPQGGHVPELNTKIATEFKKNCKISNQKEWYVHTPYFINFASAEPRIKHASIAVVRQELERASTLGAKYLMTHLGSYASLGREKGFIQLVDALKETLAGYKGQTKFLIEISAGAGEIIGGSFEDIAKIIYHPKLIKFNIGVCFDTQHAFASGYDLRDDEAVKKTFDKFDKIIGLDKLKMSHCNDSRTEFNSHSDHHDHIGEGKIGLPGFKALLSEKRLQKINFILETKPDAVANDIKLLKKIRGKTY